MKFFICEHCKNIMTLLNDSGVPAEHPMMEAHYIMFICIETSRGHQIKYLNPGEKPEAEFLLADGEELIAAYEYCNLHGLWKA